MENATAAVLHNPRSETQHQAMALQPVELIRLCNKYDMATEGIYFPSIKTYLEGREKRFKPNTLGLADPDRAVTFPARKYKVTPLFNALRPF